MKLFIGLLVYCLLWLLFGSLNMPSPTGFQIAFTTGWLAGLLVVSWWRD